MLRRDIPSADATGTKVVFRPAFLAALPRRAQMFADGRRPVFADGTPTRVRRCGRRPVFADAGADPAALTELTHTELDRHHVPARAAWAGRAAHRPERRGHPVSWFLLRRDGSRLRILVYITDEGLQT
jgi:hypothetical protein